MKKRIFLVLLCIVSLAVALCLFTACEGKDEAAAVDENPLSLAFYLKDDGTYAVEIGMAKYLSKVEIPASYKGKPVTEIGRFSDDTGNIYLTEIVIPDSVKTIGNYAFRNCDSLTSVTIGNSVETIGENAFSSCDSLTSVTIGNSVETIGENAFYNCTSLTSVTIGNSVESIGDSAFYNCTSLTSVVIPICVETIGNYAFYYCTNLKTVNIPENSQLLSIGSSAFKNCTSLTSVVIGNSVTSIGSSAFESCYKLVEVINKSSLTITKGSRDYGYVGYYAFYVHNGDSKIVDKDGYLFYTVDGVNYLVNYVGTDTDLTLPSDYNDQKYVIYKNAFYNNDKITSVTIPNSVTSIGNSAFHNCSRLTSITIPDSVTSIGEDAFYDCDSLTSVVIGNSVTSIGEDAFYSCGSLTSIKYRGTEEQWNKISKEYHWNYNTGNYTVTYNYTGE